MDAPLVEKITQAAWRVLEIETLAIQQLKNSIDNQFINCVYTILQTKGRVIVTGIGKSAIIGKKIVATFNSTGTPAIFMHAADAIHGDLGMIQQADIVLILSQSGNTSEIKTLLPLIRHLGNSIAAITGNKQSVLAQNADFLLLTPIDQEACPHNLAPTASTAAQLAMGDALAICVLELRGFTPSDFAKYHPGGLLGKQLHLRAIDVCTHNLVPKVMATASFKAVIMEISSKRLGATAVMDIANRLIGIITDGDLRRALQKNEAAMTLSARDIMTSSPKVVQKDALAVTALKIMQVHKITQLPVMNKETYIGVIHLHDLIKEGLV